MEQYGIGMMAKSLAGHDKGKTYLVSAVDDQYVYLVDGRIRTIDHPKRKKKIHIQIDHRITEWIRELLDQGKSIQDPDVVRALKDYGIKKQEV